MENIINPQRLLDCFRQLVAIDSPSFGERAMADTLTARLTALGFAVREDGAGRKIGGNAGNLFATLPGKLPMEPILLCAHMDTVAPAYGKRAVAEPDGYVHTAGDTVLGADDLSAVAAILEAVAALKEHGIPHRPVEVLFSVAEEAYCVGASAFDFSAVRSREAYVPDLDGPVGTAANRAPTLLDFAVTIRGKASHAGFAPEKGVSAILAAAEALCRTPGGRVSPEATLNFGAIQGGTATNIVPDCCTVQGEIRSLDDGRAFRLLENLKETFRLVCGEYGAEFSIRENCRFHAYHVPEDAPVAQRYQRVCRRLGCVPAFVDTFGGSDNNYLAAAGIQGIVMASAMHGCHTCGEYTSVPEMTQIARIVAELLCER